MAIELTDEVNEYLSSKEFGKLAQFSSLWLTTSPTREQMIQWELLKDSLSGFVNWLFDNERLGVFRRDQ